MSPSGSKLNTYHVPILEQGRRNVFDYGEDILFQNRLYSPRILNFHKFHKFLTQLDLGGTRRIGWDFFQPILLFKRIFHS